MSGWAPASVCSLLTLKNSIGWLAWAGIANTASAANAPSAASAARRPYGRDDRALGACVIILFGSLLIVRSAMLPPVGPALSVPVVLCVFVVLFHALPVAPHESPLARLPRRFPARHALTAAAS